MTIIATPKKVEQPVVTNAIDDSVQSTVINVPERKGKYDLSNCVGCFDEDIPFED